MAKFNLTIKTQNIPKWARAAIAVGPVLVFAAVFAFLVLVPKGKELEALKSEIDEQEKEVAKAQSMAGRLDELKAENAKLKDWLLLLQARLPEEEEISPLLEQISDLAVESGLKILTWKPSTRRKHQSGIVYEVPVAITFSGSFHKLGNFFARLTELDRIVNISNINLGATQAKDNEVVLSITFSAVTFTVVSEGGITASQ